MPTYVSEWISKRGVPVTRAKIIHKNGMVSWETWRTPESTLAKYVDELQKDCRELDDGADFEDKYNGPLQYRVNQLHCYFVNGHNGINKYWNTVEGSGRYWNKIRSGREIVDLPCLPAPLLDWAIHFDMHGIVKQLIQLGADVSEVSFEGTSEKIQEHLNNAEKIRSRYLKLHPGMSKLWHESWGKLDWENTPDEELSKQVKELLADGADYFIRAKEDGPTAVHFAANYGHTKTLQTLIEAGADIFTRVPHKDGDWTPLSYAVRHGKIGTALKIMKLNDEYGEDWLYDYDTAIGLALKKGLIKTAKAIIEQGKKSKYAPKYAKELQEMSFNALEKGDEATVQKMLECGVGIHETDKYGRTILHLAAREGKTDLVEKLIHDFNYPIKQDNSGKTPLHWAALYGRSDIVSKLLEAGVYPNTKDNTGRTALFYAVMRCPDETVQKLIEAGAKVKSRDNNGWSILEVARGESKKELLLNAEQIRKDYLSTHPQMNGQNTPVLVARQKVAGSEADKSIDREHS